ncbi:tRNA1(Val) (adenine(37)-N6)-methyltransferase [Candidatus Phycosocius spiralis]|uniref:Methyltransferase n=1 Tax=Candidatus Phycosocius spiralis TaxID=2815099 RepID=A0ABQ4PV76_9PROT|nr:methyltransferase domain-containing protein [Candidatus Phycosocius spiralis]GIU66932.1 methyltransferase [Candidatus Phycosocius spiralis]
MLATSFDLFLKGALTIEQPVNGYRAGSDAVLLAAAAVSFEGHNMLEAGCGVGAVLLSLAHLRGDRDLTLHGLEKDSEVLSLAYRNQKANHLAAHIKFEQGDVLAPPNHLKGQFDLVFSNPPFFDDDRAIRDPLAARQGAYIIGAPLAAWIQSMLTMAKPKGRFLMIHRADRLADILAALVSRAGDIGVFPVRPRAGEPAKRILISARKGSRAPLRLLEGLDMHPDAGLGRFSPAYQAICEGGRLSV